MRRHRTLWTIAVVATLLVTASLVGLVIRNSVLEQRSAQRAKGLVEQIFSADIARLPQIVEEIEPYRRWADPLLDNELANAADGSVAKLQLALALLPVDDGQVDYLSGQLPVCTLDQFPVVREALLPHKDKITGGLWRLVQDEQQDAARRLQAAAALAEYDSHDARWKKLAPFVAQHLTSDVSTVYVDDWLQLFQPCSDQLADPLAGIHAERSHSEIQRQTTAFILANYLRDKPAKLATVILAADELAEFSLLIDALGRHAAAVKQQLIAEMQAAMPDKPSVEQRDAHWKRQSMAAVTLVHLGHGEKVWPLLELTPDPSLRSFVIHHLGKLEVDHITLAARLEAESKVSIRRALIQSLGGLDSAQVAPTDRNRIAEQLQAMYTNDPDSGIHSSASWTLRQWGVTLPEVRPGAAEGGARGNGARGWYINSQGQTMVVIPSEFGNSQVDRRFAISSHEVTVAEYRRFQEMPRFNQSVAPTEDCPVNHVSWFMAAEYCNWLSEQEGIPENQWIYAPNDAGEFADGMRIKENFLELSGYRLPTQAEWEHACLVGARGPYSFGAPVALLKEHGRFLLNSSGRTHPVESLEPNDAGLFDMHGNLWEWTQDANAVAGVLSPVASTGRRFLCGGSFRTPSGGAANRDFSQAINGPTSFGFRPARTHRLSSPDDNYDGRDEQSGTLSQPGSALSPCSSVDFSAVQSNVAALLDLCGYLTCFADQTPLILW